MINCDHAVLVVDSFHSTGTFTTCLRCKGDMFLTEEEVDNLWPFIYTSGQGADHDKCILIRPSDIC